MEISNIVITQDYVFLGLGYIWLVINTLGLCWWCNSEQLERASPAKLSAGDSVPAIACLANDSILWKSWTKLQAFTNDLYKIKVENCVSGYILGINCHDLFRHQQSIDHFMYHCARAHSTNSSMVYTKHRPDDWLSGWILAFIVNDIYSRIINRLINSCSSACVQLDHQAYRQWWKTWFSILPECWSLLFFSSVMLGWHQEEIMTIER